MPFIPYLSLSPLNPDSILLTKNSFILQATKHHPLPLSQVLKIKTGDKLKKKCKV